MKSIFLSLFFFFTLFSFGQISQHPQQYKFRVYLKDKGPNDFSVDNPSAFLSQQAIERKKKEKVDIDQSDFPISPDYFTLVEKAGGKVVSHSKWFSTLVVEVADSLSIQNIESLSFVDSVRYVWRGTNFNRSNLLRPRLSSFAFGGGWKPFPVDTTQYDFTASQFELHNAKALSEAGLKGKGVIVGVIDAGFTNFDVIPSFQSVRLGGYFDCVPGGDMFASSDHGTKVLSTMAVNQPGLMMGSAPEAVYYLFRSEDTASEYPVEEDYWVRAVEVADSLGVDIINTSLGYSQFDDPSLNYSVRDINGRTSFMSRAADKAYQKGLLVIVSAGNEGNKPWRKITPPADARHVLTVGAVGTDSLIASFSSRGFTADGRVKPDVVSVGRATITIGDEGVIGPSNGTSFSTPFLAGLIASLWSINPELSRSHLLDVVKRSSDRYLAPDSVYGYGIPNIHLAMKEVLGGLKTYSQQEVEGEWVIQPDSLGNYKVSLSDPIYDSSSYSFRVLNESGLLLADHRFSDDNMSIVSVLGKDVRKNNRILYFVTEKPFEQRVFRVEL